MRIKDLKARYNYFDWSFQMHLMLYFSGVKLTEHEQTVASTAALSNNTTLFHMIIWLYTVRFSTAQHVDRLPSEQSSRIHPEFSLPESLATNTVVATMVDAFHQAVKNKEISAVRKAITDAELMCDSETIITSMITGYNNTNLLIAAETSAWDIVQLLVETLANISQESMQALVLASNNDEGFLFPMIDIIIKSNRCDMLRWLLELLSDEQVENMLKAIYRRGMLLAKHQGDISIMDELSHWIEKRFIDGEQNDMVWPSIHALFQEGEYNNQQVKFIYSLACIKTSLCLSDIFVFYGLTNDMVNTLDCETKMTPLALAIVSNNVHAVNNILSIGGDVNQTFQYELTWERETTPFIYASSVGYATIVQRLVEAGASRFRDKIPPIYLNTLGFDKDKLSDKEKVEYARYMDPISHEIMTDPITLSSGITYDRASLKKYFEIQHNPETRPCPTTKYPVYFFELQNKTNVIIRDLIRDFVLRQEVEFKVRFTKQVCTEINQRFFSVCDDEEKQPDSDSSQFSLEAGRR
ncbi:MAG: hypothetical protein P1U36_08690 [Legionellaceae bacterium]|nr:hypothetical protein [Legionellaceae bacterium]